MAWKRVLARELGAGEREALEMRGSDLRVPPAHVLKRARAHGAVKVDKLPKDAQLVRLLLQGPRRVLGANRAPRTPSASSRTRQHAQTLPSPQGGGRRRGQTPGAARRAASCGPGRCLARRSSERLDHEKHHFPLGVLGRHGKFSPSTAAARALLSGLCTAVSSVPQRPQRPAVGGEGCAGRRAREGGGVRDTHGARERAGTRSTTPTRVQARLRRPVSEHQRTSEHARSTAEL